MTQQSSASAPSETPADVDSLHVSFSERTRRLAALMDLELQLSVAADRYSLAADLVRRFELPARAD